MEPALTDVVAWADLDPNCGANTEGPSGVPGTGRPTGRGYKIMPKSIPKSQNLTWKWPPPPPFFGPRVSYTSGLIQRNIGRTQNHTPGTSRSVRNRPIGWLKEHRWIGWVRSSPMASGGPRGPKRLLGAFFDLRASAEFETLAAGSAADVEPILTV